MISYFPLPIALLAAVLLNHVSGRDNVEQMLKYVIDLYHYPVKKYDEIPRLTVNDISGYRQFKYFNDEQPNEYDGEDTFGVAEDVSTFENCFMICDYYDTACQAGLYDRLTADCYIFSRALCISDELADNLLSAEPSDEAHKLYFYTGECVQSTGTTPTSTIASTTVAEDDKEGEEISGNWKNLKIMNEQHHSGKDIIILKNEVIYSKMLKTMWFTTLIVLLLSAPYCIIETEGDQDNSKI